MDLQIINGCKNINLKNIIYGNVRYVMELRNSDIFQNNEVYSIIYSYFCTFRDKFIDKNNIITKSTIRLNDYRLNNYTDYWDYEDNDWEPTTVYSDESKKKLFDEWETINLIFGYNDFIIHHYHKNIGYLINTFNVDAYTAIFIITWCNLKKIWRKIMYDLVKTYTELNIMRYVEELRLFENCLLSFDTDKIYFNNYRDHAIQYRAFLFGMILNTLFYLCFVRTRESINKRFIIYLKYKKDLEDSSFEIYLNQMYDKDRVNFQNNLENMDYNINYDIKEKFLYDIKLNPNYRGYNAYDEFSDTEISYFFSSDNYNYENNRDIYEVYLKFIPITPPKLFDLAVCKIVCYSNTTKFDINNLKYIIPNQLIKILERKKWLTKECYY